MSGITFYGGINEIGGNKFLLEDKGTKVFLDFGMQMGKANSYFAEFTQPRKLNGMGDLFEFDLLPKLHGLYRRDYSKHMKFEDDHKNETEFSAVLLTHAHVDHCAYIHYLRPEIPVYCTEATEMIMRVFQDTGGKEEYITYKENFKFYEKRSGGSGRATKPENREETKRKIRHIEPFKRFKIDSIEVEPIPVDHSLPGVCGFIIHTSKGTVGYTGDLRFHGRRRKESEEFIKRCADTGLDHMLCEGTRVDVKESKTEMDVEETAVDAADKTKELMVITYPVRDLDRLLSFYNAAKRTGRTLVIDTKQAHLLKLIEESGCSTDYPHLVDPVIRVYLARKSWGLLDKDYEPDVIGGDYKKWERKFLESGDYITYKDVSENQKQYMFYCNDFGLKELIDVRPSEGSSYLRSSTEPFDDEMVLDHDRVRRWLVQFGLLKKDEDWRTAHVSGHGTGDQIERLVKETNSKEITPIHTQNGLYFNKWHKNVRHVTPGETMAL